jgi:hypothetical protein
MYLIIRTPSDIAKLRTTSKIRYDLAGFLLFGGGRCPWRYYLRMTVDSAKPHRQEDEPLMSELHTEALWAAFQALPSKQPYLTRHPQTWTEPCEVMVE